MKYRMIAIDMDGTLLNPEHQVSSMTRDALAKAHAAGVRIVPCTGRSWREAMAILHDVEHLTVGIFNTGAVINDIATGDALDHAPFDPQVAHDLIQCLNQGPEAILAFREAGRVGHEYLVTGQGQLDSNTRNWFAVTQSLVHHQPQVTADDLHHTVRLAMVAPASRMADLMAQLQPHRHHINAHAFDALPMPGDAENLHILEVFAAGVTKWRGIQWVAQQHDIDEAHIAVIGDQINDLPMFEAAHLAIAMGNAIDPIKQAADHVTLSNAHDGVAHAIHQMLDGHW